jgi:RND family efflux transporter MFP subunit
MKTRRIITITIIVLLVAAIVFRLASNKKDLDNQLKMVSEFNSAVPVNIDTVKYKSIASDFQENGTFQANRELSITSETQGKVASISAKTGEYVKAGQMLATVENEVYKSQLDVAKSDLEKAEKDMHRFEELSKGEAATTQQFEAAKQTYINAQSAFVSLKKQYDNTVIKAPFSGMLTGQHIEKGSYLMPGSTVFDMVEIDQLKLIVKLSGEKLENVRKGQFVKVTADLFPEASFDGKVSAIVVKADLSKRYDVEIIVDNHRNNEIKPGMTGVAVFSGPLDSQALVIPRKAISGSIRNPEVFVVKGSSVVLQSISVLPLNDKNMIVGKGLKAGDVIVVSGQINLVDGSKITMNK